MTHYTFETTWRLGAPLADVWEAIVRSDRWPSWWRGVESVEVLSAGDEDGIGARQRLTWRSRLNYRLAFEVEVVRAQPMSLIEGHARGELEGTGIWRLEEADGVTTVRYTWHVSTRKRWMNLLAPLARPVFRWSHDHIMRSGATGLARLLDAELIEG